MKVLFAVNNDKVSETIIRRYQKDYKEIISGKNVYYFNAIFKELQKDKSYDRIIISEDLEPFSNNNYEAVDKFIFEKLDQISDEAFNQDGANIPIILVATDRRTRPEPLLVRLFGIGIYDVLIGQDRSVEKVCSLLNKPRSKKEAKLYYKIDSENVEYKAENENDVSETEIQNILAHYKKLGRNEEKYVQSFDSIAEQYNDEQLKLIVNFLPKNVTSVLEDNSARYRILMGLGPKRGTNTKSAKGKEKNQKIEFIEKELNKQKLSKPVIIPTSVDTNNVKRRIASKKREEEQEEIITTKNNTTQTIGKKELKENVENMDVKNSEVRKKSMNPDIDEYIEQEEVQEVKRGRGRPRKNKEELPNVDSIVDGTPKRKRGRPPKNKNIEVEEETNNISKKKNVKSSDNKYEEEKKMYKEPEEDEEDDIFDGIGFVDFQDESSNKGKKGGHEEDNDIQRSEDFDEYEEDELPGFDDEEDNDELPGFDDDNEEEEEPRFQDDEEADDELPGFDDDNEEEEEPRFQDDEEADDELPGFDDDNEEEEESSFQDDEEDDDGLPGFDDDEEEEEEPSFQDDEEDDDGLPGFDDDDEEEEEEEPGIQDDEDDDDGLPGFDDDDIDVDEYDDEASHDAGPISNPNFVRLDPISANNSSKQIESANKYNSSVNFDIDNLITSNQKVVSFVGTSKNGTSFIVNNLAQLFAEKGIDTAILDLTKNRNAYYIYTDNREDLRTVAHNCIDNLRSGVAEGIKVDRHLTVYTSLPDETDGLEDYGKILETLVENYSVVLLDCDFNTRYEYFNAVQEIYLVQSFDILTIQPLTAFLRELKARDMLNQNKIRIVLNKHMNLRDLTDRLLIGGMSSYNDPSMSFMTELFNKNEVKYYTIPFDVQAYTKYLNGLVDCKITLRGYSKGILQSLERLANQVFPLINGKNTARVNNYNNYNSNFSNDTNGILNKMKKKY